MFDMIIALYKNCDGDWQKLAAQARLDYSDIEAFLDYAASFLSNVGNYYASCQIRNANGRILTFSRAPETRNLFQI